MATAFYVTGGALVVIALVISFLGMKSDSFPSDNALRIGTAFVAIVVIATAVLAVRTSQNEAAEREHEENILASEESEETDIGDQQIGEQEADDGGSGVTTGSDEQAPGSRDEVDEGDKNSATGAGDPTAGLAVFNDQGCAGCHSLQAADATGQIGPNLDVELVDKDETYIETSIVDPSDDVVEGFSDGIMPSDYGEVIPSDGLADLVAFLYDSTHKAAK